MLVCPECETENRIGAIFCRECGEKLDVSDMRPPKKSEQGGRGGIRKLFRWLVGLAILGGIVYGAVAMFTPQEPAVDSVSSRRGNELMNDFHDIVDGRGRGSYTLNSAEATFLLNEILGLDDMAADVGGAVMVPQRIEVELRSNNEIKTVIRHRLFDQLDSDAIMIGKVEATGNGVKFVPHTYKFGDLPMVWYFEELVMGRFSQQFFDRPDLDKANQRVQSLTIERGRAEIVIE